MSQNNSKLIWNRVNETFDLIVTNPVEIDMAKIRSLLKKVESNCPDYNKPFSKEASKYFQHWMEFPTEPLKEAAYCLLSNWFLTKSAAAKSTRADYAYKLWNHLFCVIPERRLSDWKINGSKVIPQEFQLWWRKQRNCQRIDSK